MNAGKSLKNKERKMTLVRMRSLNPIEVPEIREIVDCVEK